MPKLKTLSGKNVICILEQYGFKIVGQKGSHVKLQRVVDGKVKQTLTIPNHQELDRGTIKAIYNQASQYISAADLYKYFYTE